MNLQIKNIQRIFLKEQLNVDDIQVLHQHCQTYNKYRRREIQKILFDSCVNNKFYNIDRKNYMIKTKENEYYYSCSYMYKNVIIAISKNKVGIDFEANNKINEENLNIFSDKKEMEIVKKVFDIQSNSIAVTMLWCLKESLGKYYNVGFKNGFKFFSIIEEEDRLYISADNIQVNNQINIFFGFNNQLCLAMVS